jgi:hypothetical protein
VSRVSMRLRSAEADPHITEVVQDPRGAGRANRGWLVRTLSCAGVHGTLPWHPFPGSRVRCPPGERPTSRPCSTDESVAMRHRFQCLTARVSHGLVSPSRSSPSRCCPSESVRRSVLLPLVVPRAEARGPSWVAFRRRSPVGERVGPLSRREWREGSAASLPGLLATPRPGITPCAGFVAPPPKSVRERESRAAFRREPLVASGFSSGPSRRPPWGL